MGNNAPRSVRIGGRRTSMRLESQFWDALKDLARREQADIGEICTQIARRAGRNNLSSAVRVAVMAYYRDIAFNQPPVSTHSQAPAGD